MACWASPWQATPARILTAAQKQTLDVYLVDADGVVVSRPAQSAWLFRSLGTPSGAALAAVSAQGSPGAGCPAGATSCAPGQATARLRAVAVPGAEPLGDQLRAAFGSGDTGQLPLLQPLGPGRGGTGGRLRRQLARDRLRQRAEPDRGGVGRAGQPADGRGGRARGGLPGAGPGLAVGRAADGRVGSACWPWLLGWPWRSRSQA